MKKQKKNKKEKRQKKKWRDDKYNSAINKLKSGKTAVSNAASATARGVSSAASGVSSGVSGVVTATQEAIQAGNEWRRDKYDAAKNKYAKYKMDKLTKKQELDIINVISKYHPNIIESVLSKNDIKFDIKKIKKLKIDDANKFSSVILPELFLINGGSIEAYKDLIEGFKEALESFKTPTVMMSNDGEKQYEVEFHKIFSKEIKSLNSTFDKALKPFLKNEGVFAGKHKSSLRGGDSSEYDSDESSLGESSIDSIVNEIME